MLKKLTKFEWFGIGVWLVIVVAFGVMSRSLHVAYQWLVIGVFFCFPIVTSRMIDAGHKVWLIIGLCGSFVWLVVFAFGFLNIVERIYLVNGDHYPRWLADGEISQKDPLKMERICHRGVDLFAKPNGLYVWRCGSLWYESTTLVSTFNPYEYQNFYYVYIADKNGKSELLQPNNWYLIPANGLKQALRADSEAQCKLAMSKLRNSICMPGKALKQLNVK